MTNNRDLALMWLQTALFEFKAASVEIELNLKSGEACKAFYSLGKGRLIDATSDLRNAMSDCKANGVSAEELAAYVK